MIDDAGTLREIAENTRAIAQLLALSVGREVRDKLGAVLDTDSKRAAYVASDGQRSAREVGRLADSTHPTIRRWWNEWTELGLAEEDSSGRVRAVLDLRLFALSGFFDGRP